MAPERQKFWRQAFASLTAIAKGWTQNGPDSEDLAQAALTEAWLQAPDETDVRAMVRKAALLMKGKLSNDRRDAKRRGTERWLGAAVEATRGLRRTPEQLAATRERKEAFLARLRKVLARDPEGLALVDETLRDHTTAAEQAEGLGWEIDRVRNTRKRVDRAIEAVKEEDGAPESGRGWDDRGEGEDAEEQDGADSGAES